MRESDAVESARRALGAQLAAYRHAAGYSQAEFASVVGYSRSTVANVETGRQNVPGGSGQALMKPFRQKALSLKPATKSRPPSAGSTRRPRAAPAHPFWLWLEEMVRPVLGR